MNRIEREMVKVLTDLRQNHGVTGIKAEFEAEGTRIEEALRLKEVITTAGLNLTLKIGGCEAIRDLYEARVIGVERIVAPMVETPFALEKYISAINLAFPEEEQSDIDFCVNIETITAVENFEKMLCMPGIEKLGGIVVGRVDLTGSLGLTREDVNSVKILDIAKNVATKAKKVGLETIVGGGVSAHSIPFAQSMGNLLDRYETRKVIFDSKVALLKSPEVGILKAVNFELLWLKNKRDYYRLIATEDATRITMLEKRYRKMIDEVSANSPEGEKTLGHYTSGLAFN